jgi:hypothetical protein
LRREDEVRKQTAAWKSVKYQIARGQMNVVRSKSNATVLRFELFGNTKWIPNWVGGKRDEEGKFEGEGEAAALGVRVLVERSKGKEQTEADDRSALPNGIPPGSN